MELARPSTTHTRPWSPSGSRIYSNGNRRRLQSPAGRRARCFAGGVTPMGLRSMLQSRSRTFAGLPSITQLSPTPSETSRPSAALRLTDEQHSSELAHPQRSLGTSKSGKLRSLPPIRTSLFLGDAPIAIVRTLNHLRLASVLHDQDMELHPIPASMRFRHACNGSI